MISIAEQREFLERELGRLDDALGLHTSEYLAELELLESLVSGIEAQVGPVDFFRTKSWDSVLRLGLYRVMQYCVSRSVSASRIIETGVLHGLSTSFPLAALAANNNGRMVSIDLPSNFEEGPSNTDGFTDVLPPGMMPGWAIPNTLRDRWTLKLGPSTQLLQGALTELGEIDLFIHDSDHTYETMTFEFETAWPSLKEGGVLIADNVDVNTSFFDFARKVNRVPYITPVDPEHAIPGASGIRCGVLRR